MRVYALKEHVKRSIWHPIGHMKFNANGVADWPNDQFTRRRLRDGDISLTPPTKSLTPPPQQPPATGRRHKETQEAKVTS